MYVWTPNHSFRLIGSGDSLSVGLDELDSAVLVHVDDGRGIQCEWNAPNSLQWLRGRVEIQCEDGETLECCREQLTRLHMDLINVDSPIKVAGTKWQWQQILDFPIRVKSFNKSFLKVFASHSLIYMDDFLRLGNFIEKDGVEVVGFQSDQKDLLIPRDISDSTAQIQLQFEDGSILKCFRYQVRRLGMNVVPLKSEELTMPVKGTKEQWQKILGFPHHVQSFDTSFDQIFKKHRLAYHCHHVTIELSELVKDDDGNEHLDDVIQTV